MLNFGASSSHTLEVGIVDDSLVEATESFILTLARASLVPRFSVDPPQATVNILDNDSEFLCLPLQLAKGAV